jgi:hypothetical protein
MALMVASGIGWSRSWLDGSWPPASYDATMAKGMPGADGNLT